MPGMDSYSKAAVERAMKVQEVILRAMAKRTTTKTCNRSETFRGIKKALHLVMRSQQ